MGSVRRTRVCALVSATFVSATMAMEVSAAPRGEVDIVETFSAEGMPDYLVPYMSAWKVGRG